MPSCRVGEPRPSPSLMPPAAVSRLLPLRVNPTDPPLRLQLMKAAARCLPFLLSASMFLLLVPGCDRGDKLQLAFVINNPSDFWTFARAGIRKAEKEFQVAVDFQVPGGGQAAQQRQIIE